MRGWDVSGIRGEDSSSRECFLGTLQKDDDGSGKFGEDGGHQEHKNEQEEAEAEGA